jgi:S-adenosylmethionine synthetase
MKREYLLTSESVSEGHPDKIADQISDSVLDVFLAEDPSARVGCETLITRGLAVVAGEVASHAKPSIPDVVRWVIKNIGYTDPDYGFDYRSCGVVTQLNRQSPELCQALKPGGEGICANDQVTIFGYATNETPELMPLGIMLAHSLVHKQAVLRKDGILDWLRPDAKSQVTVRYVGNQPVSVEKVVLSTQHSPGVSNKQLREEIISRVIEEVIPKELRAPRIEYLVNPGGSFTIGGPAADTGLTGRKIIADAYGPGLPHGGGAFSGKDPTKLDRSGAYIARYIAKNIVAAGLAERCIVQLSYVIGKAEPVSLTIDRCDTGRVDERNLVKAVRQTFDLTPQGIINTLDLSWPAYRKTAVYGHFGRRLPEFPWETTDQVSKLGEYFGIQQDGFEHIKAGVQGSRTVFAVGRNIDWDELRQFDTEFDYFTNEVITRSNSSFETDFKRFLKSRYAQNRVVLLDQSVSHVMAQRCIVPSVKQVIKGEHEFIVPESSKVCLQLLKLESDKYICVTMNSHFTDPEAIEAEIDDRYRFRETPGVPSFHPGPEPTNSGQIYLAVIHFTSKYVTRTETPYSHITVHRIDDNAKISKLVARFEDGEELRIAED